MASFQLLACVSTLTFVWSVSTAYNPAEILAVVQARLNEKLDVLQRIKRSASGSDDPSSHIADNVVAMFESNCTMACNDRMERDFNKTFSGKKNVTKDSNQMATQLSENYKEKDLNMLCGAYLPSSKCIKACPSYEFMKPMMLDMLTMLEYMCVTHNADLKQYMPCVSKHNADINPQCEPKCSKYESAVDRVLDKSSLEHVDDKKIRKIQKDFNDTCSYIQCENNCEPPLIAKYCGMKAAATVQNLYLALFHSIKSILSSVNIVRDANSTIELSLVCKGLPPESS